MGGYAYSMLGSSLIVTSALTRSACIFLRLTQIYYAVAIRALGAAEGSGSVIQPLDLVNGWQQYFQQPQCTHSCSPVFVFWDGMAEHANMDCHLICNCPDLVQ